MAVVVTLAASFGDVLDKIVGILLSLAGLSTGIMCLLALTEAVRRRAVIGLLAGIGLLLAGLWLLGFLG